MDDIFERVKKIIVEKLFIDDEKISESSRFIEDLGADSLEAVELMMAFEEEFDIEIDNAAIEKIHAVSEIIDYIKNNFKG